MTHHVETNTIEAGIERDRASLASTLSNLQDRVSVEHLAQEALGMIRGNAQAVTRSIDGAVRANPMALALTGVGLAWLIFGAKKSGDAPAAPAVQRWEDEGGTPTYPGESAVQLGASARETDWSRDIDALRDRASASLREIERDNRSHTQNLRAGVARAYDTARDFAADRAAVLADFAAGIKESLAHGLDDLASTARERIIATREQAYAARLRAERLAKTGTREAGRVIEDHPMVAGAAALALGAAFAAALPRTRVENRAFGAESDRLMTLAADQLRAERKRAERVAAGVAQELKSSVSSAASTVSDAVSEGVSDTIETLKERAQAEASKGKARTSA